MKTKKKMNPKGKGQGPPEWKEASGSSGWNLGTITSDLPSLISKMGAIRNLRLFQGWNKNPGMQAT